jgi:hypothetical protein
MLVSRYAIARLYTAQSRHANQDISDDADGEELLEGRERSMVFWDSKRDKTTNKRGRLLWVHVWVRFSDGARANEGRDKVARRTAPDPLF